MRMTAAAHSMEGFLSIMCWPKFASRALGSFAQFEHEFEGHLSNIKLYAALENKRALLILAFPTMARNVCKNHHDPFTTWSLAEHPKILLEHKQAWLQAGNLEVDYEGMEFIGADGKLVPDLWMSYLAKVKAKFDISDPDAKWRVRRFQQAEAETPMQAVQRFMDLVGRIRKGDISDDDLATYFFDGLRDEELRESIMMAHMKLPLDKIGTWSLAFVTNHAQRYYVIKCITCRGVVMEGSSEPKRNGSAAVSFTADDLPLSDQVVMPRESQASRDSRKATMRSTKIASNQANNLQGTPKANQGAPSATQRGRGARGGRDNIQRRRADGCPCSYAKCLGRRAAHSETECWTRQLDEGRVDAQAPPPAYFVERHKMARASEAKAMMSRLIT
ncbi:hypothetical protein Vretifemale_7430 [Volvox reticuliferus]|nr:hypothetical protein Vretifemale_7430 [Volvox reticuliferus]